MHPSRGAENVKKSFKTICSKTLVLQITKKVKQIVGNNVLPFYLNNGKYFLGTGQKEKVCKFHIGDYVIFLSILVIPFSLN